MQNVSLCPATHCHRTRLISRQFCNGNKISMYGNDRIMPKYDNKTQTLNMKIVLTP